ncbi:MAG: hypothetical protein HYU37_10550 [Acidobacteria bacterium]|nr:hypothetical protein [Acidobacteriota bacterium]
MDEERGSALIAVLLLLVLMSALAAALTVSGRTETLVARNHQSAAQALAAAEAGLNHAVAAATAFLATWQTKGYATVGDAVDALFADGTLLEPDITLGALTALGSGVEYEVSLMDEDDPARGADATDLTGDADASNDEDGAAGTDRNLKLIVRAVGYTSDNASAVVEAVIAPRSLPAVLIDGDVEIDGSAVIAGESGSAHANADMELDGNATVAGDATASGTLVQDGSSSVGGLATSDAAIIGVPEIRASDYRAGADFILTDAGQVTLVSGTVLCDASGDSQACEAAYGWRFEGANGWRLENDNTAGSFYVEGDVDINGNIGSVADPLELTVVAEGSIDVNGTPVLTPETPELMFVAEGDLRIQGNFQMPLTAEGQILVHEQARIYGNAVVAGQVIVENANHEEEGPGHRDHDDLENENRITGNAQITYSGDLGTGWYEVTGWRHVR